MGLELHVSNSLERLAHELVERLRAWRAREGGSMFDTLPVVVANRTVRTYAQFALARQLGVAAGFELVFPQRFVGARLAKPARVVERGELETLLTGLLGDEAVTSRAGLEPVRAYLEAGKKHARERRRFQLATRIARVLDDYSYSRADMLLAWRNGTTLDASHPQAATERWQRELWLALFGAGGALERLRDAGTTWLAAHDVDVEGPAFDAPDEVHVFGFSYLAPLHRRLFHDLSRRARVFVYAFSPTTESGGEATLRAFGAPSREHVELWRADGHEARLHLVVPEGEGLLRALQRQVLVGGTAPTPVKADASVRLHACPSLAREVEVVAGEIWEVIREGRARGERPRFDEIAVLVAGRDQDAYRSQIASVFARAHEIPVRFSGLGRRESRVVEAVRLLLELPRGELARGEVLKLITHPNVLARFPDVDKDRWISWCDELEILGGADRSDLAGTYVGRDLFTWDQGLKRLALGAFLTGERGRESAPVRVGDDDYLPLDHPQDEGEPAALLILLVRALIADARFARRGERPLAEWARFLQRLVLGYLSPRDDGEGQVLDRCARALRRLEGLDLDGRPIGYRVAFELAWAAIDDATSGSGGHELAEGVLVAPIGPARPIPFRAIFVLGLGEGAFPAASREDVLDLRALERRPGDVTPEERDRHSFLEILSSARERLALSWVARDATTGESLAPSSVIREVEAAGVRVTHHPLRRWAPACFAPPLGDGEASRWGPAEAFREAQARALREQVPVGARPEPSPALDALIGKVAPPEPAPATEARRTVRVSISALLDFLASPIQAWAKHRLRLREDQESADPFLTEDEVFEPSRLDETVLLREVAFTAFARAGTQAKGEVAKVYRELAARAELEGRFPTGVFLEATEARHRRLLEVWCANLASALSDGELRALSSHRFGPADERGASDVLNGPVVLELAGGLRVEVHGRTNRIVPGHGGAVVLVMNEAPEERHALRAFLDHAVLAAEGLGCQGAFRALVVPGTYKAPRNYTRRFTPFSREEARAWLSCLAGELVGGQHAYLLPLEPVLDFLRGTTRYPLAQNIRWLRDRSFQKTSDSRGPLAGVDRFGPPPDAEAIARRRLEAYVRRELAGGAP